MTIGFGKDQSHSRRCRGKILFLRSNHSQNHNRDRDTLHECDIPQIAMTRLKGGGDVVIESLNSHDCLIVSCIVIASHFRVHVYKYACMYQYAESYMSCHSTE